MKPEYNVEFIPYYIQEKREYGFTHSEAIIYGFIRFYTKGGQNFYFSNEDISRITGCSRDVITKAIKKYEELGIFEVVYSTSGDGGTARFINPTTENKESGSRLLKTSRGSTENKESVSRENVAYNNTNNNNIYDYPIVSNIDEPDWESLTDEELQEYVKGVYKSSATTEIKRRRGLSPWNRNNLPKKKYVIKQVAVPKSDYQDANSITPQILKEVSKETKTYPEDVENIFKSMIAWNKSSGKGWNNLREQLISRILDLKLQGKIEEKKSLEEQIREQYGEIL